jgi:hypothetical protein
VKRTIEDPTRYLDNEHADIVSVLLQRNADEEIGPMLDAIREGKLDALEKLLRKQDDALADIAKKQKQLLGEKEALKRASSKLKQ